MYLHRQAKKIRSSAKCGSFCLLFCIGLPSINPFRVCGLHVCVWHVCVVCAAIVAAATCQQQRSFISNQPSVLGSTYTYTSQHVYFVGYDMNEYCCNKTRMYSFQLPRNSPPPASSAGCRAAKSPKILPDPRPFAAVEGNLRRTRRLKAVPLLLNL